MQIGPATALARKLSLWSPIKQQVADASDTVTMRREVLPLLLGRFVTLLFRKCISLSILGTNFSKTMLRRALEQPLPTVFTPDRPLSDVKRRNELMIAVAANRA